MTDCLAPRCIVCDCTDSTVFWHEPQRTIRRCRSCDLLFVFPQPSREKLHQEFQSDYFALGRPVGQTRLHLEFDLWRRPSLERVAAKIRELKPNGTLLDVGCASGTLFDYFRDDGWQLYGVEPSALAFEHARQRVADHPRIHLFNGYLLDVDFSPASFDVVTVLESLYYMPDPRLELARITHILKKDGLLVVEIPGYAYQRLRRTGLLSFLADRKWCTLTHSHLFYFSTSNLIRLLSRFNFEVIGRAPEQTSVRGTGSGVLITIQSYFLAARLVFALSGGRFNLAPRLVLYANKAP